MAETQAPLHNHPDPFGERLPPGGGISKTIALLGGRFEFRGALPELIELVERAYAGLPAQQWARRNAPYFQIELRCTEGRGLHGLQAPPPVRMQGGAGLFGVLMDAKNLALVVPELRRGVVSLSASLLREFPYHARYELLEFAVFTLASRAQGLLPLHGACVGLGGVGALLIGGSGAGKSTLALQALQQGLDFLTEDAVFVNPPDLSATGVANFLHLRCDARLFVENETLAVQIRQSPVILRRSGVEKFEIDLRQLAGARLAPAPLRLTHLVFLSAQTAALHEPLLRPLESNELAARLTASQPYAAQQPGWSSFSERFARLRAFELKRGPHPRESVTRLHELLSEAAAAG